MNVVTPLSPAPARGFPAFRDLSSPDRIAVRATASIDVGLRTAAAAMIAGAILPEVLNPKRLAFDAEQLRFYAGLGRIGDASLSFPAPTETVQVHRRTASRPASILAPGHVDHVWFDSPFQPLNPAMRERWKRFRRNGVAHAQHWRHQDGPRPTLIVIHGFFASPHVLNGAFFALPWFFRSGFDVLLYTLPFHGARRERFAPFSGSGVFSSGQSGFAEAMGQAIHDLRLFIDYLDGETGGAVGVTGLSLGGYTSALLSTVEPRLSVVVPNVPVTDPHRLLRSWVPAGQIVAAAGKVGGADVDLLAAGSAFHSPLSYPTLVGKEARLIITGLGDRLAPPDQSEALWQHWDRCALYWFPGSHILHIDQRNYLRRMARFMRGAGFAPPEWAAA
jgi:pimeloyl-ACP methyl ester carboxylesterase